MQAGVLSRLALWTTLIIMLAGAEEPAPRRPRAMPIPETVQALTADTSAKMKQRVRKGHTQMGPPPPPTGGGLTTAALQQHEAGKRSGQIHVMFQVSVIIHLACISFSHNSADPRARLKKHRALWQPHPYVREEHELDRYAPAPLVSAVRDALHACWQTSMPL
jgi:hypothetical protein